MKQFFFWKATMLSLCFVLLSIGCQKDKLFQSEFDAHQAIAPSFSITISEAKSHFEHAKPVDARGGGDENIKFVKLEPDWNQARTSTSVTGKEIIVVPLDDAPLAGSNGGRAGAQLIFGKDSLQNIETNLLLHSADSAYYAAKNGQIQFNDFTGAFLFFNLDQTYKTGVWVTNGLPRVVIDSLNVTEKGERVHHGVQDRDDICFEVHINVFNSEILDDCINCVTDYSYDGMACHSTAGGGGGGAGPVWGGTPGSGGGNNNGPGIITYYEPTAWWSVFGSVPLDVFIRNGGTLPSNLDVATLQKLIAINQVTKLSTDQIDWLARTENRELVNVLHHFLQLDAPAQSDDMSLRSQAQQVINFFMKTKIPVTPVRFNQMLNNPELFNGLSLFKSTYPHGDGVNDIMQQIMDHAASKNATDFDIDDFADFGAGQFSCPLCLAAATAQEYGMLVHERCQTPCSSAQKAALYAEALWTTTQLFVHLALDGLGMIPVYGEIFDAANGVLYNVEGNHVDAAYSYASMVPFVGWTATGAKYARKIVNVGGNSMKLVYQVTSNNVITFGSRSQLRLVLNTAAGFQAHHIIPWEKSTHALVQAASDVRHGDAFHMNDFLNGVSLPQAYGQGATLVTHNGSHNLYAIRVEQSMTNVFNTLVKDPVTGKVDPTQAKNALTALINKINVAIHTHPPSATATINDVVW